MEQQPNHLSSHQRHGSPTHKGSILSWIIYTNCTIYILAIAARFFLQRYTYLHQGFGDVENIRITILQWIGLSSNLDIVASYPWTVLTYMFCHADFLHLFFNMLILYWVSRYFLRIFSSAQLGALYLLGGFVGAAFFLLATNLIPALSGIPDIFASNSTAAVLAVVSGLCFYRPNNKVSFSLFGEISYLGLWIVILFFILIWAAPGNEFVKHITDIGGALTGMLFGICMRNNIDITAWMRAIGRLFVFRKHRDFSDPENQANKGVPDRINEILDKVSKDGYESLTSEEKRILFLHDNQE